MQNDSLTLNRIAIEYPKENERITSSHYTFRVDAPGAQKVLISVDDGRWQPCRLAGDYWWFDWSSYRSGRHEVEAKAFIHRGRVLVSEIRRFQVDTIE